MKRDFGEKLDELRGGWQFFSRVVMPSSLTLTGLLIYMYESGYPSFPMANKMILQICIAGILLLLAANTYRACRMRLEIYQRGIVQYGPKGRLDISYMQIKHFEWEDDDIQFLSIRICRKQCHIVCKETGKRIASVSSRDFAKMIAKMSKLEYKLKLR